jgi:formamidopyrimidine-DNA glycosylase
MPGGTFCGTTSGLVAWYNKGKVEAPMPELPDLEIIREYLAPRLTGVNIVSADAPRPLIVRNLLGDDLSEHLAGQPICSVDRRGKFLLLGIGDGLHLVINPMLAGRLRYGQPLARKRTRDALILGLNDGNELRYHDAADMGKIYLTTDLDAVPGFAGQGPEATDPALTLDAFRARLRGRRGEIKGVLTDQSFVAGIGNAYADEILWAAHIYPFRFANRLSVAEVATLYEAMRAVLAAAIEMLHAQVGDAIDVEVRDFLSVHGKAGQPCPRCGATISEVQRNRIATQFCRTCQPGLMIDR